MSAESDLRGVLIGFGSLTSLVPASSIGLDAALQDTPRPYIVIGKQSNLDDLGLDNTVLAQTDTFDIQCVGTDRANAIAVKDQVKAALRASGIPSDRGTAGYDPELGAEVEVVTVDWIDV
jgi:hypothetical protein